MNEIMNMVERFIANHQLEKEEYILLLELLADDSEENAALKNEVASRLKEEAVRLRKEHYGDQVFVRALIEFSNICKNNCYYCGIQCSNNKVDRYRLTKEEILSCCDLGYAQGYRTFVLQSGEDPYYTDDRMVEIIRSIKEKYPECAITLSIGEKSKDSYRMYREAGADRYLLRHETANEEHYRKLHPENMKLSVRKQCLYDLMELGFQVGAGFMVGSPGQTMEALADDMIFLKELSPHMVGIGPFIPHHDTRFKDHPAGSVDFTINLLSMIRILLPKVLLPATTALGSADPLGREKGLMAGANVVMPNISPTENRKLYELYDNKICVNENVDQCSGCLERRIQFAGYRMVMGRGDFAGFF